MAAQLITLPGSDISRFRDFFIIPARWVDNVALATSTAEDYTPPSGAKYLLFDYETGKADVWVQFYDSVTAAAPSGDVTNGSAPIRNPLNIELLSYAVMEISLFSTEAQNVTIQVWK